MALFFVNPNLPLLTYIGTYTREQGPGIVEARWEANAVHTRVVAETENPSFLATHPTLPVLYCVNEAPNGRVSAFRHDAPTGRLTFLGELSTGGAAPCHLAVHPSGRWLAVANYRGAQTVVLFLDTVGRLRCIADSVTHTGAGHHPTRQRQPHPHGVYWTAEGRCLLVPDLGTDRVVEYAFDPLSGKLTHTASDWTTHPESGPRHLALLGSRWVYVLNELSSTLDVWDRASGHRRPLTTISTLPAGVAPNQSTTAEIALHPSGRWAYVTNRGHDSLAVIGLADPACPKLLGHVPSGGAHPRHASISADGKTLWVSNQHTHRVCPFSIHPSTGDLVPLPFSAEIRAPACVTEALF